MPPRPNPPKLLLAGLAAGLAGCQVAPQPPASGGGEATFRGQSPAAVLGAPWGPSYLAPGELSCDTPPPPVGLGYEVVVPQPAFATPSVLAPRSAPPAAPPVAEPGWFDVLPAEGGPISDDFGLPDEPTSAGGVPNPLYVRVTNPDAAWEEIVRVVARYFPIAGEERVAQAGSVLTEGRVETQWQIGSTIFEPWRRDSAGAFNRWQSTLQTIRRRASLRVIPAAGGYEILVRVDKQLEDLNRPERASAGAASIQTNQGLPSDRVTPIDPIRDSGLWIDIGRDAALEQRILGRLRDRFTQG
ncbi:hypothetical protein [Botrimarina sp.]|uniref:hypothetical protein n=1 Tax=Botrimarina sp. TaxID=2795802 RepID=UPI0032EC94EC